MAVGDSGLLAVGDDITEVAKESVGQIADEDTELISIYYGEEYSEEDASKLAKALEEQYPDCSVEVVAGGQPVYYCIISAE